MRQPSPGRRGERRSNWLRSHGSSESQVSARKANGPRAREGTQLNGGVQALSAHG
jgi:hypothetical protein